MGNREDSLGSPGKQLDSAVDQLRPAAAAAAVEVVAAAAAAAAAADRGTFSSHRAYCRQWP